MGDFGMIPPMLQEYDMLQSMQAQLNSYLAEKTAMQKQLQNLDDKLKAGFASQGPRIRETEEEIEKGMKDLEKERTSRSLNLAEEKKILRKIDDLKRQRTKLRAYKDAEENLQKLKATKSGVMDALRAKEQTIHELQQGIRKVQLAQRVGVNVGDLINTTVDLPEASIPRVIGKGGSNLKAIEESCKVSIDVDQAKQVARISGGVDACEAAKLKIEEITLSIVEDLPVNEALLQTLLLQKATMLQTLMLQHNVRLDVIRTEKVLRATGLPNHLAAVKDALATIPAGTETVPVDARLVPAVVGKSGANFRRVEEEYSVSIDVDRSENNSAIVIRGLQDQAAGAAAEIHRLIASYEDKEVRLECERFLAKLLMDDGAKVVKDLRKATGCLVLVDAKKEDDHGVVRVKGQSYKIQEAVEVVEKTLESLRSSTLDLLVDAEMVRHIIGKKGAVITKIRQDTGALVETDVQGGLLRIYSEDPEKREAAKAEILKVVDKNQVSETEVCKEAAISLKGSKGQELREKLINELEVNLDIDSNSGRIQLRGSVEKMEEAKVLLDAFSDANYGIEMDLLPDDQATLQSGGDTSLRKQVTDSTGAQLFQVKEENLLKIRGTKEAVLAAEAAIRKALDGDDDGSSATVAVDPEAFPALIGKSGATINKLREEYGVDLIRLKVRSVLRIRGEPAKVAVAKEALEKYLAELRITFTVNATKSQVESLDNRKVLQELGRKYDVNIDRAPEGIKIRGLVAEAVAARTALKETLTGRARHVVAISPEQMAQLAGQGDVNWRRVREEFAVSVDLDRTHHSIILQGSHLAIPKAKEYTYRLLDLIFPSQFGRVPIPPEALSSFSSPQVLHRIQEESGVDALWPDREQGCLRLRGEASKIAAATTLAQNHLADWATKHATVAFEGWMLPYLIGKGGSKLKEVEASSGASIDVDRESGLARISGPDSTSVQAAKKSLEESVEVIRKECAEVEVPKEVIPALIGKKGSNLSAIRQDSGATIDIPHDGKGSVRIRGSEEALAKAKTAIETFVKEWTRTNTTAEVSLLADQFRLIVGKSGATVRHIEEETETKIDVDRERKVVVVRGSPENVERGRHMVQQIVDEDNAEREREQKLARQSAPSSSEEPKHSSSVAAAGTGEAGVSQGGVKAGWVFPTVPPGMDPEKARQLAEAAQTKSGSKNKKKKNKAATTTTTTTTTGAAVPPPSSNGVGEVHAPPSSSAPPFAETTSKPRGGGAAHSTSTTTTTTSKKEEATVPAEVALDPAVIRSVVKTQTASELLDLILTGGKAQGSGSTKGGDEEEAGSGSSSRYYKSSTGFSVRL